MRPRIPFFNMHEQGGSEWKCLYAKFIWECFRIVRMALNYWRVASWSLAVHGHWVCPLSGCPSPRCHRLGRGRWPGTRRHPATLASHCPDDFLQVAPQSMLLQTARLRWSLSAWRMNRVSLLGFCFHVQVLDIPSLGWAWSPTANQRVNLVVPRYFPPRNAERVSTLLFKTLGHHQIKDLQGPKLFLQRRKGSDAGGLLQLTSVSVRLHVEPVLSWHLCTEWLGRSFFVLFGGDDLFPRFSL